MKTKTMKKSAKQKKLVELSRDEIRSRLESIESVVSRIARVKDSTGNDVPFGANLTKSVVYESGGEFTKAVAEILGEEGVNPFRSILSVSREDGKGSASIRIKAAVAFFIVEGREKTASFSMGEPEDLAKILGATDEHIKKIAEKIVESEEEEKKKNA